MNATCDLSRVYRVSRLMTAQTSPSHLAILCRSPTTWLLKFHDLTSINVEIIQLPKLRILGKICSFSCPSLFITH